MVWNELFTLPNNDFSKILHTKGRFGHDIVQNEIIENVYVSVNNPPNGFLKFCGIGDAGVYVSEVSVDQNGNKLIILWFFKMILKTNKMCSSGIR